MMSSSELTTKEVSASGPVFDLVSSPQRVPISTNKNKVAYVSPGILDSEGFLAPPPASTLLIRRTRTNSSGSSTYVIASSSPSTPANSIEGSTEGQELPSKLLDQHDASLRNNISTTHSNSANLNQQISPLHSLEAQTNSITSAEGHISSAPQNADQFKIPKLYLSKIKSLTIPCTIGGIVKKRGPRGKYKERKKINIDVLTGKRRYTRRKLLGIERKPKDNDSSSDKGDNEYESDDSNDSRPCLSDNGIWRPTDDLRLIANITQTCSLKYVHVGVKFSCKFTLEEITGRWRSLLYDEKISKLSQTAINNLHPLVKQRILSRVLFSDKEEALIKTAPVGNPDIKVFQKLLEENKEVFYKIRTPQCLFKHWLCLKELNMLNCQKTRRAPERFEVFELGVDDEKLMAEPVDKAIMREVIIARRRNIRKIKKLEREVKSLQSIVDNIVLKDTVVKTDTINSFATLKGRQVQYLMRSQEITFGRRTSHNFVDADIQMEGSANQVSRMQGKIALEENGDFHVYNLGRNHITVNFKPLRPYSRCLIEDQAIILIGTLSFIFEVNKSIIGYIKKMYNDKNESRRKSIWTSEGHCKDQRQSPSSIENHSIENQMGSGSYSFIS